MRDSLESTVCHNFKMGDKDRDDPIAKSRKMSSALDQLKQYTTVVADTGDFEGKWACHTHECVKKKSREISAVASDLLKFSISYSE